VCVCYIVGDLTEQKQSLKKRCLKAVQMMSLKITTQVETCVCVKGNVHVVPMCSNMRDSCGQQIICFYMWDHGSAHVTFRGERSTN
jgi:hypothetical protein